MQKHSTQHTRVSTHIVHRLWAWQVLKNAYEAGCLGRGHSLFLSNCNWWERAVPEECPTTTGCDCLWHHLLEVTEKSTYCLKGQIGIKQRQLKRLWLLKRAVNTNAFLSLSLNLCIELNTKCHCYLCEPIRFLSAVKSKVLCHSFLLKSSICTWCMQGCNYLNYLYAFYCN